MATNAENSFPKEDGWYDFASEGNAAYFQQIMSSTLNYANITVAATATVIKAANTSRKSILIQNMGSEDLYIGDSGVTTAQGIAVKAGKSHYLKGDKGAIYGINASGGMDVRYWEVE